MDKKKLLSKIRAIIIPGLVFQSVVTGGGFATGREIVQYCLRHGVAFIWILLIVFSAFTLLFFLLIETAKRFKAYDYRSWAKKVLPKFWIVLDVLFIMMAILVCAIVLSGAVEVLQDIIAIPAILGMSGAILIIGLISFGGRKLVLFTKVIGALLLTFGYLAFAIGSIQNSTKELLSTSTMIVSKDSWLFSALEYVGYNTVALPACLYALTDIKSTKQSIIASIIAGILLVIPMFLVAISILTLAPNILTSPVPLHDVIKYLRSPLLLGIYYCILIWTLIDTAIGMVFAITNRIEIHLYDLGKKKLTGWYRAILAVSFVIASTLLAQVGIIALVAKGYSLMAYCFIAILVIPLIYVGTMSVTSSYRKS